MHEIERKFLLRKPIEQVIIGCERVLEVEQHYLSGSTGDWTTRVRKVTRVASGETRHLMTLKRRVGDMRCVELETVIDDSFYATMVAQSGPALRKRRHELRVGDHLWEIDQFHDLDLVIAEIELTHEDEAFVLPSWAGKEVTSKRRYANKNLAKMLCIKR